MAYVKGLFWNSQYYYKQTGIDLFKDYSLKELIDIGVVNVSQNSILPNSKIKTQDDLSKLNDIYKKHNTSREVYDYSKFFDTNGRLIPDARPKYNPNSTLFEDINVGLIERFEECSLITGEKYIDGYDRKGFNKDGFDKLKFDRLGFNAKHIHKTTGTIYDDRGFYYDVTTGEYLNKETKSQYDMLGYNIYGYDEKGFERPKGFTYSRTGEISRYIMPLWHKKLEDGFYDVHGYQYCEKGQEENIERQDAHGFVSQKANISDNPLFDRNKREYFLQDGKKSSSVKNSVILNNYYYIENIDIDGFDKNGYRKITNEKTGEILYINRDTSSIYDRAGRIIQSSNNLTPVVAPIIDDSKKIIQILLSGVTAENKTIEETLYAWYSKYSSDGQNYLFENGSSMPIEVTKKRIKEVLKEAFEVYQIYSPKAFDEEISDKEDRFKGLEEYYTKDITTSTEKRERIKAFFNLCPTALDIIKSKVNMNNEILQIYEEMNLEHSNQSLPQKENEEDRVSNNSKERKKSVNNSDFDEH